MTGAPVAMRQVNSLASTSTSMAEAAGHSGALAALRAVVPVAQEAEIAKLEFQLKGAKCTGCAPGTGCWLNPDVATLILWVKQNACNHQVLEGLAQMADTCRKMKVALNLARLHACQQRNLQRQAFSRGPLTGAMPDGASSRSANVVPHESPAAVAVMTATGRLLPSMPGGHSYNPLRKPNLGSDTGRAMPAAMAGEQRKRPLSDLPSMLNGGLGRTKQPSKEARYSSIFSPSFRRPPQDHFVLEIKL